MHDKTNRQQVSLFHKHTDHRVRGNATVRIARLSEVLLHLLDALEGRTHVFAGNDDVLSHHQTVLRNKLLHHRPVYSSPPCRKATVVSQIHEHGVNTHTALADQVVHDSGHFRNRIHIQYRNLVVLLLRGRIV